jgi:hypothetical protein
MKCILRSKGLELLQEITAGNAITMQPPQIWWEKPIGRAPTGLLRWLTLNT